MSARLVQSWPEANTTVRLIRGMVHLSHGEYSWDGREVVCWETPIPGGWFVECAFVGDVESRTDGQLTFGRDSFVAFESPHRLQFRNVKDSIQADGSIEKTVQAAAARRATQGNRSEEKIRTVQADAGDWLAGRPVTGNPPGSIGNTTIAPIPAPDLNISQSAQNGFETDPLFEPPMAGPRLVIPPPLLPPSLAPGQFSNDQLFPASFADRVTIVPRNPEVGFILETRPVEGTSPPEQIITVTRGVNVVIDRPLEGNQLDLTADAAVIWTDAVSAGNTNKTLDLGPDTPFQVYLQGNIILRQGSTVARASEAYFDRREGRGLLRNAEVRSYVPSLRGDLRVRAQQVRFNLLGDQLQTLGGSDIEIQANDAWVTASRFGKPTYRLQAGSLALQQRPAGRAVDSATGQVSTITEPWLVSQNNQFLLGEVPIAATPYLASPAEDFSIPIKRVAVSSDRIFGTQLLTRWDVSDLFGIPLGSGSEWTLDADYLSDRGPRLGTDWKYDIEHDLFGLRASTFGEGMATFVYDEGRDNLGFGRQNLGLEDESRGAVIGRSRTKVSPDITITTEIGYISDFNFLEQYEEQQWDSGKDAETLIELRRQFDNSSWSLLARPQVNDFVNQTQWLPRFDVTTLGQPLFVLDRINSSINWSQHSMVGYAELEPSSLPPNLGAPGQFGVAHTQLPYVANVGGTVAMTRHELTLPFNLGAVKVVPYALGELAYWQEGLDGNDLGRAYGAAGIRGSLMMTKVMPYVRSDIFGLSGLAHRMVFDFDYSIAESTTNLDEIAQYNEFNDNAQERFNERIPALTYGGALPITADPRGYALRSGAGRSVTAPYHELVDDQHVLRLGWRHRLQTRTGPPQNRRLRDWMTLDLEASFFPGADDFNAEDNFGETAGLLSAKYAWNVSERTSILADALYDMFNLGQETWSVGVLTQRPGRGSMYLGYRRIGLGALDSEILSFNYSYAMSPKWLSYYGFAYDLSEGRSQGHTLGIAKVGRDFITRLGVTYDESKDDLGVSFLIEPFIGSTDADDLDKILGSRARINPRRPR